MSFCVSGRRWKACVSRPCNDLNDLYPETLHLRFADVKNFLTTDRMDETSADRRESVLSDIEPVPRTSRDIINAEESDEDFSNPLYRTSTDGTEVGARSLAPGTTDRSRRAVGADAYDSDDSTSSEQGLQFTDIPKLPWNEQIGLQVHQLTPYYCFNSQASFLLVSCCLIGKCSAGVVPGGPELWGGEFEAAQRAGLCHCGACIRAAHESGRPAASRSCRHVSEGKTIYTGPLPSCQPFP